MNVILIYFSSPMMIHLYCFIKDFGRLVGSQYSNANNKTYFCRFCLHRFSRAYNAQDRSHHRRTCEDMEKKLKAHERNCFAFAALRTEFPDEYRLKHHLQFIQILVMGTSVKNISLVLTPTRLLVVYLELNLNRGYMLE